VTLSSLGNKDTLLLRVSVDMVDGTEVWLSPLRGCAFTGWYNRPFFCDGNEDEPDLHAFIKDEDEPDDDEAPPAPKEAPRGFRLAATPPSDEMLAFSKELSAADELVGYSILYNWPVVGWCELARSRLATQMVASPR
jgi:hypothetical protein